MRSLFLLKLLLSEHAGVERRPLRLAQHALALPALGALEARPHRGVGAEHVLVRFRLETTQSVVEFIDGLLADGTETTASRSARGASIKA